jgi:two-component sensor histidine kinase
MISVIRSLLSLYFIFCSWYCLGQQHLISSEDLLDSAHHYYRKDFDKSKAFAEKAWRQSERTGKDSIALKSREMIARSCNYLSQYDSAFYHFSALLEVYEQNADTSLQAFILNRLGETKRLQEDYEAALEYLQESIKLSMAIKDSSEVGSGYVSIGILYAVQGNTRSAEEYFLKAIEIFRLTGIEQRQYLTILNLGGLYRDMQAYDQSVDYSLQALDYFKRMENLPRVGISHYNLGAAYFKLAEFDKSEYHLREALKTFIELGDVMRENGSYMRLSEVYFATGQKDKALSFSLKALDGFRSIQNLGQEIWATDKLSEIYADLGQFEKALDYRNLNVRLKDSLDNKEVTARIAEIEEQYQTELKDEALRQANTELELNQLRIQKQQNAQYVITALAIFIFIILFLVYRQYRVKKQTSKVLQDKNQIIETALEEKDLLLKEVHHRVKNNLQFITSMLNIQARHLTDEHAKTILAEAKNRIQSMALVHQKLYGGSDVKGVEMSDYLDHLLNHLKNSYSWDSYATIQLNVDKLSLDLDCAMPIGLIVNELVTNCFKYANNANDRLKVDVHLAERGEQLWLTVSDNGEDSEQVDQHKNSFGYTLVETLAEMLKAEVHLRSGAVGMSVDVVIHKYMKV